MPELTLEGSAMEYEEMTIYFDDDVGTVEAYDTQTMDDTTPSTSPTSRRWSMSSALVWLSSKRFGPSESKPTNLPPEKNNTGGATHTTATLSLSPPVIYGKSALIDAEIVTILRESLPIVLQNDSWNLLYSVLNDGSDMMSFYKRCSASLHTLIIIETEKGDIFGGFAASKWTPAKDFYGSGECFVFTLDINRTMKTYRWTQQNEFCMFSSHYRVGMGGGGEGFAFVLDADFYSGGTYRSETFGNPILAAEETFRVRNVEATYTVLMLSYGMLQEAEEYVGDVERLLSSSISRLHDSEVRNVIGEIISIDDNVHTTAAIEKLEAIVDKKIRDLMVSFVAHRSKVVSKLHDVRDANELELSSYDTSSRHREAEAIRIETTRLQDKYEKDLKNKTEQLVHSKYMNKLLTKEIYFLMEKNTELGEDIEKERSKVQSVESSESGSRQIQKPKARITRRAKPKTPITPNSPKDVSRMKESSSQSNVLLPSTSRGSQSSLNVSLAVAGDAPVLSAPTLSEMFPYELPPEIMAYAQALDSAPLATEDPTIAVSQTDADTSQDAIPNSTVEGATEEGAVVLEPIAVEVELGDYCGPELPPHLKPENTYLDQRMLSLKSIANDEEHEKIRQTIIDSYGLVREVHVEKSVSELISAYNKKDEEYVKLHPPAAVPRSANKAVSHFQLHPGPYETMKTVHELGSYRVIDAESQTETLFTGPLERARHAKPPPHLVSAEVQTDSTAFVANKSSQTTQRTGAVEQPSPFKKPVSQVYQLQTKSWMTDASENDDASSLSDDNDRLHREISEHAIRSETLKSLNTHLEKEIHHLARKLREFEDLTRSLQMHVAQLEKDKEDLTAEVESLKNMLVVKDNRYTIDTYERDALLRELSQQLFDSKEEIELLRRRVREYERGRQMESKQQRGRTSLSMTMLDPMASLRTSGEFVNQMVSMSLPNLRGVSVVVDPAESSPAGTPAKTKEIQSIKQILSAAKPSTSHGSRKKGLKYFNTGPEMIASLKGTKLAVMKSEGGIKPIVLDSTSLAELQALRKDVVNKIVDKATALKINAK